MPSAAQLDKTQRYIALARTQGARLVAGGSRPPGAAFERGYWVEPTVFADVRSDMRIAREEVFGPILSILEWNSDAEAIAIANDVDLGLTSAVWTNDLKRALWFAHRLEAGYVWINGSSANYLGTPFAGRKSSGVGQEENMDELLSYTETKSIHFVAP
ncbi:MAG: aldehyde dehydrogenase family protein [Steroidobacteraceae bacterium]